MIKNIFKSSFFTTIFVGINIILMHIFGQDIFGNIPIYSGYRYATTFGDRAIAGTYLLNFFAFGYLFLLKKNSFLPIFFYLIFIGIAILLSLDRAPFVLFNLFLFLLFLFNYKKYLLFYLLIFISNLLIFFLLFSIKPIIKEKYSSQEFLIFKEDSTKEIERITKYKEEKFLNPESYDNTNYKAYGYKRLYHESLKIFFFEKSLFGSGIKSFSKRCESFRLNTDNYSKLIGYYKACQPHTHNLYLEVAISGGVICLFLFIYLIFGIFIKSKLFDKSFFQNQLLIIIAISLIIEFFPLRPYGNLFNTYNGFYFFLKIGILFSLSINYYKLKNKIK